MFTEVHSAFSEFLYIFRSFILNVYTDLDFFIIIICFGFFYMVNGKDVVTLVCFYLMLHYVVNMLNQKQKTPLFGMVFDGGLFCNSAE